MHVTSGQGHQRVPEEFDRSKHDYDVACQWFKQIASAVPKDLLPDNVDISLNSLPSHPRFSGHDADGFIERFNSRSMSTIAPQSTGGSWSTPNAPSEMPSRQSAI
jgi:hypothetical protein